MHPEKITVEGDKRGEHSYKDVESAVIKLSGKYYWKDDNERIVKIPTKSGGYRLYRKASPLIVHVGGGKYIPKKDAVQTKDGVYLSKENAVKVDGEYVRSNYCADVHGKKYLITDNRIVRCNFSRKYILKTEAIILAEKWYKDNRFLSPDEQHRVVMSDDGYIVEGDAVLFVHEDGSRKYYHYQQVDKMQTMNVFNKFKDDTNPQVDRLDLAKANREHAKMFVDYPKLGVYVHKTQVAELDKIYEDVIERALRDETDKIRKAINKNYSDAGEDENQAKIINTKYQTWPGKHVIYANNNFAITSKTLAKVGGIGYTFGVEFETSAGILTKDSAQKLDLLTVGDRSIGAAEYVTPVLHGDKGVEYLEKVCKELAKSTFVDDRCGLHIHVGGMKGFPKVTMPNLSRTFCQNAVKLGCQIEEALYKISPVNRVPTLYHCHSIMRWKGINSKNWREYLGAFVFGPKESWDRPFNFRNYAFGEGGRTSETNVGTWCGGRYKWLNLVNALTNTTHKTCEFRLFAGTTNFRKVYAYLLMSLAFVWLVENKPKQIETGTTLEGMLESAYSKNDKIKRFLLDFIKERNTKFNRKNVYTRKIPAPNTD